MYIHDINRKNNCNRNCKNCDELQLGICDQIDAIEADGIFRLVKKGHGNISDLLAKSVS